MIIPAEKTLRVPLLSAMLFSAMLFSATLFQVSSFDPASIAAVLTLVLAVAAAALIPAWRASRTDPMNIRREP